MVFSGKKQSRIWLVSVLYRSILNSQPLFQLPEVSSVSELWNFFDDNVIFSYEDGDLNYFKQVYETLINNIAEIENKLSEILKTKQHFLQIGYKNASNTVEMLENAANPLIYSCFALAIAEMDFMKIEQRIVLGAYKEILRNYSVDGSEKMIDALWTKEAATEAEAETGAIEG